MEFQYEKPVSIDELAQLLDRVGARSALLAGGTDLMVQLRARITRPEVVIDIKGIDELMQLEHHDDGSVTMGAAVNMTRLIEDPICQKKLAALVVSCEQIATHPLRNRATVAGNIANASPCGDSIPALCVLGAQVDLRSSQGKRRLSVPEFIRGVRVTVRKHNEFIEAIHFPSHGPRAKSYFRKLQRVKGHDLALVNAALFYDPDVPQLIVTVGSCSPVPAVLHMDDLCGALNDPETAEVAADRAMKAICPISDVRASAEYRTDMTGVLVRRLFSDLRLGLS